VKRNLKVGGQQSLLLSNSAARCYINSVTGSSTNVVSTISSVTVILLIISRMLPYNLRCLADSSVLLTWFVKNYICKYAPHCPNNLSECDKVVRAVNAVTDWKLDRQAKDLWNDQRKFENRILTYLQMCGTDAMRTLMEMKDLQNDDQSPCDYYIAFVCLHVAYTTSIHSLSEDQLDVLFVLFDPQQLKLFIQPPAALSTDHFCPSERQLSSHVCRMFAAMP